MLLRAAASGHCKQMAEQRCVDWTDWIGGSNNYWEGQRQKEWEVFR
jgi:hypothetical protein